MPDRLYWVTLRTREREGGERQFRIVFACEFQTVADIAAELREFGVVHGQRLRLVDDGHGGRRACEREDYMFGAGIVGSVQVYPRPVAGL